MYWKGKTSGHRQSRHLLECIKDNFLMQVAEKPNRENSLLGL